MSKAMTPNQREILAARSTVTGQAEYLTSTNGALNTTGGGGGGSTQYAEGVTTNPSTGTVALGRYESAPSGLSVDGGLYPPLMDNFHQLKVVPVGTVSSQITDGTNSANVLKSDGTAAGQNSLMVAPTSMTVAFSTTTAQAVATTDAANYASVSVYIAQQGTGSTITFQTSNDNVNWSSNALEVSSNSGTIAQSSSVASITYMGSIRGRYFRLNVSGISAGTTSGTVVFSTAPRGQLAVNANQNGSWSVGSSSATGSTVPANAFYMGMMNASGNLTGISSASNVGDSSGNSLLATASTVFNGTSWDRLRAIVNATNSIGTGIMAAGILAQLDDTSPTSITENSFGNLRMATDRSLLVASRATTPAQTSVAASATSTTVLASNASRKGATITNDSSAVLYLKLGATASTTSYTVTLVGSAAAPFAYYEVPFGYIGVIDGIWASATGNARVTEIT